jgi:hypothetical protein
LRLLLDEMYPPTIAGQLRLGGHDVEAVADRAELRGLTDAEVFAAAAAEARAVVTENIADFVELASASDRLGDSHHGLVIVDPAKFPRGGRRTIGRMITALGLLLSEHPGSDATSVRRWL